MLGDGDSVINKTNVAFLILYLTKPLAEGLGDTTLETKSTPFFYEYYLNGYSESNNA